jgi:hypothetical protein
MGQDQPLLSPGAGKGGGVNGHGRPLRFVGLVVLGWVGVRVAVLWPQTGTLPKAIEAVVPPAAAAAIVVPPPAAPPRAVPGRAPAQPPAPVVARASPGAPVPLLKLEPSRFDAAAWRRIGFVPVDPIGAPGAPRGGAARPAAWAAPERWSATAWAALRGGAGSGAAPGGQLGGSQAGARIAYLLSPERSLAVAGRIVSPLNGRGAEAALGLEWQPVGLPVRLVVEHRFGLDGTAGGPGLGLVGGLDRVLEGGLRLEGYGQAGAIRRARAEPYADAAARLTRKVAQRRRAQLSLGLGAWGAAQRDAARLDLGASAVLGVPLAAGQARIAFDWRRRIAGRARPGSGLALTIGGDF